MKRNTESWERATVKGALLWGSVYSAATGAAYWLVPATRDGMAPFPEVLKHAVVLFSVCGAMRGALMWRVKSGYYAFRFGKRHTNF